MPRMDSRVRFSVTPYIRLAVRLSETFNAARK